MLALAWVAVYPLSYATAGLVRARRNQRFRKPFVLWLLVWSAPAAVLLVARPWLLWVGLGYLALFGVNLGYARRNDERSLVNDAVLVVECAAVVALCWAVGAGTQGWTPPALSEAPARLPVLVLVCALVLVGSTLHVKSLVRERRDPRYALASRVVAAVSVVAAAGLALWWGAPGGLWLLVPFVVLAARSLLLGRRPVRPARVGLVELGCFVLVTVMAIAAAA